MKGIVVTGSYHWGFSIRIPKTSAGGASYPVPPISTLLGALSRGYCDHAVSSKRSCTEEFINNVARKDLFWITLGLDEPLLMPYSDMMRESRIPYKQSKYKKLNEIGQWFGVSSFGKVYGPCSRFEIFLVVKDNAELWTKLAWQIPSMGSKESIVSVYSVIVDDLKEVNEDKFETNAYFPSKCLTSRLEGLEELSMPVENNYELSSKSVEAKRFIHALVPRNLGYGGYVKINKNNINQECVIYKIKDYYIIMDRDGIWSSKLS
ncbi:type I-A CRISPR-associated protein Cas5a [Acidianus manzaensis]|uniref:Type I-A CRISPR-associated protein Cas5 n=1 Tax=Acidianus manzaensis TaxID=282676 RepID=A0A1W6JWH1_9CREN|nr:type I-A CRISPR-associated protein Cas5a [Acidianus manzaensis]ARM74580.1 type I-A CRISPR-associated protein Cas5 [Acidianus manzaensis]